MDFAPSTQAIPRHELGMAYNDQNNFSHFLREVMMPEAHAGGGNSFHPDNMFDFSPKDVLDFSADTTFGMPEMFNLDLMNSGDFSFQPARYYENVDGPSRSGYTTPVGRGGISLGAQAFRESLWLWTPAKDDYGAAEQLNLSVPSQDLLPETQSTSPEARVGSIDRVARDRILAMVLDTCDAAVVPRVVQSFPSPELLTNLVHNFLDVHSMATDHWIHLPTFDPNSEPPTMLSAVIAAGATMSNVPDVRKLGFAFLEAAREAIANLVG